MAQFGRPDADTLVDNWTEDDATTDALYAEIDDVSADDATYIISQTAPSSDVYVTHLSDVEDPGVHTGHVVRYRYSKSDSGGAQIDLTVELREGYVDESSKGTLIKQFAHTDISSSWTTTSNTLDEADAATITDYTDLFLRFVANQV